MARREGLGGHHCPMALSAGVTGRKTAQGYLAPVLVVQTRGIRPSSGLQDSRAPSTEY
jgi:hypothetical protein